MSLSCRYAAQRCARQLGTAARPSTMTRIASTRRYNSTEAAPAAPENPKIAGIVDQISQLTLLETADLVSSLKVSSPEANIVPSPETARSILGSPRFQGVKAMLTQL